MKHEETAQFKTARAGAEELSMIGAISEAKAALMTLMRLEVDSIVQCSKDAEGNWLIALDVIESAARMGDNDLLATYEVQISPTAELKQFNRLRRYHREDKES